MHFHSRAGARRGALAGLLLAALLVPHASRADDPKFNFGKEEDLKKLPPWSASITAGFGLTTGNAQSLNLTGGGNVAYRFDGVNLLTLDGNVALQRSTIETATDLDGNGVIGPGEVQSITQSVSEAWGVRLRYDRFFGFNSIYAFGFAGGDVPAGKQFVGGGQVGYSRALWKTATSELVGEAGLDYTFQRYVVGDPNTLNIAALRFFLGYLGTPNPDLQYNASVEYLGNLNTLDSPTGKLNAFADNRLVGRLGVTWKIFGDGSLGFRFRALYDSAPAPKPPPAGFAWAPGYQPLAKEWDTFTELVLVYKLL
ncbi:MAG TPA: DUF481 domain-containing protein [Anaeromyxobacteraceae bacterium]|nr:DUF481 domain-containing protein [Anaeromyxobacteraceae bacterium]